MPYQERETKVQYGAFLAIPLKYDPEELAGDQLAAWARFQDGDPLLASPFLRPEFTRIAALVRRDVAVAVAEEGGQPRGFLPFQRHRRSGGPVGGGLSDCQAVVAAPGWDFDARALVRAAGLALYEFTHLIGEGYGPTRSAFLSAFFALVGCHGAHVTIGMVWLTTMMAQVWAKGFREDILRRVACWALFWHALDIIWVALFTTVYLLGSGV